MPLAAQVRVIPNVRLHRWNEIATSCHFATVYYIHSEEFSRSPSLENYLNIGNPGLVINQMLRYGRRVNRPSQGNVVFTPGSVYVFVRNNTAQHSCIAIDNNTVGGYNQTGWFTVGGDNHGYSVHAAGTLNWGNKNYVLAQGLPHELWEIPEITARATLRQNAYPG